jgi:hypothetical protein
MSKKASLLFVTVAFLTFCIGLWVGWYQRTEFDVGIANGVVQEIALFENADSEYYRGAIAVLRVYANQINKTRFLMLEEQE